MGKLLLGVDLGGTNVRAGLVSREALVKIASLSVRSQGSESEVFSDLCSAIDQVFTTEVAGIGIGVPSLLDPKTGVIFDTINIPAWREVPLKERLEQKYSVPVRIDNDANCFAIGEKVYGRGRGCDNFVGLVLGTGLGAGIISNGQLHSGIYCGAGEFGMIPYRDSIIENYASGQFFKRQGMDGYALGQAAERGDAKALEMFKEFGGHMAFVFKAILYTLAPEMIILGGSVSKSYKFFEPALQRALEDFGYPTVRRNLRVSVSNLKESAILGAACLFQ